MGRAAKGMDEAEIQEILAMKDDLLAQQQETAALRGDVSKLQQDITSISGTQGEMNSAVGQMQKAMADIGLQLSNISSVLSKLQVTPPAPTARAPAQDVGTSGQEKSPTLQHVQARTEFLRNQLEKEKEITRQMEDVHQQNLPPIRTNRLQRPPGFHSNTAPGQSSEVGTPLGSQHTDHTPVFNQYQQNRERQMWQGYFRTYEQDMRAQFMKSITKGPKMDFPRFDGTDPVGWIRQCNKYFQMSAAPEEYKLSLAQLYITGDADVWLRRSGLLNKKLTWQQFCKELIHRFSASGSYDLTDKFNTIRQNNQTVKEYTKTFEDLMAEVQEDNPNISESWFVRCYVNGLREGIKYQVRPLRPASLTDAYWLAIDIEPCHPPKKNYNTYHIPYAKYQQTQFNRTDHVQLPGTSVKTTETTTVPQQKIRKVGECWRCGDKWMHGHKCKLIPNVHLMQEELQNSEDHLQSGSETNEEEENPTQTEEKVMHISAQAIGELPLTALPTVIICIGGKRTVALLDSGSNSTYIDQTFAIKANCNLQVAAIKNICVAGGGLLQSTAIVQDCEFTISKHKFHHHFRVLDLPGQDVILGCDWFSMVSPVAFDLPKSTVTITLETGNPITLPLCPAVQEPKQIPAEKLNRMMDKGATGYFIQMVSETTAPKHTVPQPVQHLLDKYSDVFEEPKQLPPSRSLDHTIPLIPGAEPPQLRPYRLPHYQKTEMENQVKELLENNIIRPSQSPFASPAILVKKKDKSFRLCIDFRKVNSITVKNKFPIPIIEDLLDELHGAKVFFQN